MSKNGFPIFLRGKPGGQSVSKNEFPSFCFVVVANLHINYAGCPEGIPCLKMGSVSFFSW